MTEKSEYKITMEDCPNACTAKDKVMELEAENNDLIQEIQDEQRKLKRFKEETRGDVSKEKREEIYLKLERDDRIKEMDNNIIDLRSTISKKNNELKDLRDKLQGKEEEIRNLIAEYDEVRLSRQIKKLRYIRKKKKKEIKLLEKERLKLVKQVARLRGDKLVLEEGNQEQIHKLKQAKKELRYIKRKNQINKKVKRKGIFPKIKFLVRN